MHAQQKIPITYHINPHMPIHIPIKWLLSIYYTLYVSKSSSSIIVVTIVMTRNIKTTFVSICNT